GRPSKLKAARARRVTSWTAASSSTTSSFHELPLPSPLDGPARSSTSSAKRTSSSSSLAKTSSSSSKTSSSGIGGLRAGVGEVDGVHHEVRHHLGQRPRVAGDRQARITVDVDLVGGPFEAGPEAAKDVLEVLLHRECAPGLAGLVNSHLLEALDELVRPLQVG